MIKAKEVHLLKSMGKLRKQTVMPKKKKDKLKFAKKQIGRKVKKAFKRDDGVFEIQGTRTTFTKGAKKTREVIIRNRSEFEAYKDLATLNGEDWS